MLTGRQTRSRRHHQRGDAAGPGALRVFQLTDHAGRHRALPQALAHLVRLLRWIREMVRTSYFFVLQKPVSDENCIRYIAIVVVCKLFISCSDSISFRA